MTSPVNQGTNGIIDTMKQEPITKLYVCELCILMSHITLLMKINTAIKNRIHVTSSHDKQVKNSEEILMKNLVKLPTRLWKSFTLCYLIKHQIKWRVWLRDFIKSGHTKRNVNGRLRDINVWFISYIDLLTLRMTIKIQSQSQLFTNETLTKHRSSILLEAQLRPFYACLACGQMK